MVLACSKIFLDFDTGSIYKDQITVKELLDSLLTNVKGQKWTKKKHPWVKAYDNIWARIKAWAPHGLPDDMCRWLGDTVKVFGIRCVINSTSLIATVRHFKIQGNTTNQSSTIEERVMRSRGSSATIQTFNLVAYAYGIDLPNEIYDHPEFKRLREISSDIIVLATDVVCYVKEQTEGFNNNVISICRMRGMSAQDAHDYIGQLIEEQAQEWDLTRAAVPIFGETVDLELERYIQRIVNCSLASVHSV
jgi:hypothetical protein